MSVQKTLLLGSTGQFYKELEQAEKIVFDLFLTKENIVPITSEEYGAMVVRSKNYFLDV